MTIKAIIHTAEEGGFWAEVPALPGCVTQGETQDELRTNLREAIELSLSVDEPAVTLSMGRSRAVEQEVLAVLDAPAPR